ncbi:MAG: NusG domain II-containing protein [Firmicutes bacterium]|nr:NusG domain II-containing protein [Bacillota bacterium]
MEKKMITKADIVLAVVLLVLGLCSPFFLRTAQGEASRVIITVDGEQLGSFDLSENRTVAVVESGGEGSGKAMLKVLAKGEDPGEDVLNLIVIEGGAARVVQASCGGQDCVKMGSISRSGEVIACLPHKMLISITGDGESPDVIIK